jgi:catechol 2,3-dioxygenase-like lactoylglutathione lyase family enzyme
MLKHIAISINDKAEINDFYVNILGFEPAYDFVLDNRTAYDIFGIDYDIPVFVLKKSYVMLELFLTVEKNAGSAGHICLEINNFEETLSKIQSYKYRYNLIEREGKQICFVRDRSGNMFELKKFT